MKIHPIGVVYRFSNQRMGSNVDVRMGLGKLHGYLDMLHLFFYESMVLLLGLLIPL